MHNYGLLRTQMLMHSIATATLAHQLLPNTHTLLSVNLPTPAACKTTTCWQFARWKSKKTQLQPVARTDFDVFSSSRNNSIEFQCTKEPDMNTKFKIIAFLIIFFAFIKTANADVWSPWYNVAIIEVDSTRIYFQNVSGFVNPYNCSGGNNYISLENQVADRALQMALYAKEKGLQMKFYLAGCSSLNYINATNVQLQ